MSAAMEEHQQERLDSEAPRLNGMIYPDSGNRGRVLEKYAAREGVDPLSRAFEGKIAVHPGGRRGQGCPGRGIRPP